MMLAACAPSSAVLHPLDIPATPPTHIPDEATATGCDTLWSSERAFIAQDTTTLEEREACEAVVHPIAGARGATIQVTLTAWGGLAPAQLQITDLLGAPLASGSALASGDTLSVTLDRSGEFFVALAPSDLSELASDYALSVSCLAGCDLSYSRYPLVLLHGLGGTDAYLDLISYFYGVESALSESGYAVSTPTVDPFQATAERAEQWAEHLDRLVAEGAGRRFNLIGHSQGGLDARYLAAHLDPEARVASIVTIGTPHRGTPVADAAVGLLDISWLGAVTAELLVDSLGLLLGAGSDQELIDQLRDLSTGSQADFNASVPDRGDVYYASWAGRTCGLLDLYCIAETGGEVVDPLLVAPLLLLSVVSGDSDGIVPVSSAQWGDYRGEVSADHIDQVGHLLGSTAASFDHIAFYREEAVRLAAQGY
jgi:triacylglycerol esterase/lipase EstA (alpha/beta hydrolase family)